MGSVLLDGHLRVVSAEDRPIIGTKLESATVDRPYGWAVRTRALDDIARRNGLAVTSGARTTPDGTVLRWRMAGLAEAAAEPCLPFFIEWSEDSAPPGRADVAHRIGDVRLGRLVLEGDADRVAGWLGEHDLPIVVTPGPAGIAEVILLRAGVELVF